MGASGLLPGSVLQTLHRKGMSCHHAMELMLLISEDLQCAATWRQDGMRARQLQGKVLNSGGSSTKSAKKICKSSARY